MPRDWQPGMLGVTGTPRQLVPMVLGYEPIPEAMSVAGGDPARYLLEPVTAAAVVYDDGWVLLDSGFDVDVVRDPVRRGALFNFDSYTAVVPPGDPLPDAVAAAELDWDDLAAVAISHVHLDHTGGLRLVGPRTPVLFQRREWQHGCTLKTPHGAVVVEDFTRPGLDVVLLDGDSELAPGLHALDTSGHTPGHQSFLVELQGRTVVLACDAADLRSNVVGALACGSTMRAEDALLAERAARRLRDLDQLPDVEVWPGHDPDWAPWRGGPVCG
jgi:N-acyl homoserine lactone hydrolase